MTGDVNQNSREPGILTKIMSGVAITVAVAAAARGGAAQAARTLVAQSMRGAFAWGSSPGTATLEYVGNGTPVAQGALVTFQLGAHAFAGICKSDTLVQGSNGTLSTLEFVDMRYFLQWDWVFGAFNLPDVRLIGGVRVKRYWHIYPNDWFSQKKTYTTSPLPAWEILALAFNAPTVYTDWTYDLTGNGLWSEGLLNGPVFEIDATSGLRLDALLNLVCEKTGLVFGHDPRPAFYQGAAVGGLYRLVFNRKGYGALPLPFPANSDERRQGLTLTENPSNVVVLGDRNQYQFLNVPMVKDWAAAWEQFLDVELFVQDIFNHQSGIDPATGLVTAFNAFSGDTDQWFGYGAAKAFALEVTVGQYVALRAARPGNVDAPTFVDNRKFAGRWRMDMPAALYLTSLVFRAFKPAVTSLPINQTIPGLPSGSNHVQLPLDSAPIADQLLCRVYLDYASGNLTADPTQPVDGNGVLAVQGYQVGEDLFRLMQPDRINQNFFNAGSRGWSSVNFQIDDSGEGVRFVIADAPVFVAAPDPHGILITVGSGANQFVVLNAGFQLQTPAVTAALVFEAERYTFWRGNTGWETASGQPVYTPDQATPGRNRVEPVNGLKQEFLADWNNYGYYQEIPYADNLTANQKAAQVAQALLLQQQFYLQGGYNLKWNPSIQLSQFGQPLSPGTSSYIDRVQIQAGPNGVMEVVDFTAERTRDRFEPERELDRKSLQASLFPGQQELRQEAGDQKRLNAGIRQLDNKNLLGLFQKMLRGEADENLHYTWFTPGAGGLPATLPVGTPIVTATGANVATPPGSVTAAATNVFTGVTVRHNEPTQSGTFPVMVAGDTYARVMGPVTANQAIGLSSTGGTDFATNGAYLVAGGTPSVGVALGAITGTGVALVKVRLGASAPAAGGMNFRGYWLSASTYAVNDVVVIQGGTSGGLYISLIAGNTNNPAAGTGWQQLAGGNAVGAWS